MPARGSPIDDLLDDIDDEELLGYHVPEFETFAYSVPAATEFMGIDSPKGGAYECLERDVMTAGIKARASIPDAKKCQPYLAYLPLEVVRRTLENTTLLARLIVFTPMRKHL